MGSDLLDVPQPVLFESPPLPGTPIGRRLRLLRDHGQAAVFAADMPIFVFELSDKAARAAAIAGLARTKLATQEEIAAGFDCHRSTVKRLAGIVEREGLAAVVPAKRGPKGPHKVTSEVLAVIEEVSGLRAAAVQQLVRERTGVELSPAHLRRLRRGVKVEQPALIEIGMAHEETPAPDAFVDAAAAPPVEPITESEEPVARPPEVARGRYLGAALYYPALARLGLVEAAQACYRLPGSDLFGVRAVTLTLFFLALLGRTTVEAAKHLRRWELGALIGSGRAPVVKTLRRKLAELVRQSQAAELGRRLARRWVEQAVVAAAYLYVDGHMKVYGGKRKLAEIWNPQRRMPLPGLATYFVGDLQGRPLLLVTEEAGCSLTQAMPAIVAEVRQALGERRFTVIFDRGGYDSKLFDWLQAEGVDFITYQRGEPGLPIERFSRRRARFEGGRVYLFIAEDTVTIKGSGPWRRVVVRNPDDGHQTPILTSHGPGAPAAKVACLMLARWRQENFFRYMRQHMGLDQLTSYAFEEADQRRLVPNPDRRQLDDHLKSLRRHLQETRAELGQILLDGNHDDFALATQRESLTTLAREITEEIAQLVALRKSLPKHVPLAEAGERERLRTEQKSIIDRIKITAYNAEEWLLERLLEHYPNSHDARTLLRSFADLSGEIRTHRTGVTVTLDAPDNPTHRRALRGLCADLSQLGATYPGTQLPVTYEVAMHHSEVAA